MELRCKLDKVPDHQRNKKWYLFPDIIDKVMETPKEYDQLLLDYRNSMNFGGTEWQFFIGFSKYLANKHYYKRLSGLSLSDESIHCVIICLEVLENLVWSFFLQEPSRNMTKNEFALDVLKVFYY